MYKMCFLRKAADRVTCGLLEGLTSYMAVSVFFGLLNPGPKPTTELFRMAVLQSIGLFSFISCLYFVTTLLSPQTICLLIFNRADNCLRSLHTKRNCHF